MSKKMENELIATYRIQLNADFTFGNAEEILDYLAELGISHLYASPCFQAADKSTHGYDVVGHQRVSAELGGEEGFERLHRKLKDTGMGLVLDIVPNHMGIEGTTNRLWQDVLENGRISRYADYFDIDWECAEVGAYNKILLPVLGDHYGRVLRSGELKVGREEDSFVVRYYDHVFPLNPNSWDAILWPAAERVGSDELGFLADAFADLAVEAERRERDKEILLRQLGGLLQTENDVARAIDEAIEGMNGNVDGLDRLLGRQWYRLGYWRASADQLNYRRFFHINTLIGLRVEVPEVFDYVHEKILEWVEAGKVQGLRVDHPDGLRDPAGYLERLRRSAPSAWVVVEKILDPHEPLRRSWPVAGTTGYDFLNRVSGVMVDGSGEQTITEFYRKFTGEETDYHKVVREKKRLALDRFFRSDLIRLTSILMRATRKHREYRDYGRDQLYEATAELIASFPVYRTYVQAERGEVSEEDVEVIDRAVEEARRSRPDLEGGLFDYLRELLLLRICGRDESEWVMRFEQLTSPAAAKGVEDTAFYCFNRLVSLNEVGGDPGEFGISLERFYESCREAVEAWPTGMLGTSTHDTKRSEDVRSRIHLLSEIPGDWARAVERWSKMNEPYRRNGWPDRNTEYLLYQTLVGAWPIEDERVQGYMLKACREAKSITNWVDPNVEYEEAVRDFVHRLNGDQTFVDDLERFVGPLIYPGRVNSLSQMLIKMTAPGVPDFYQGTELWDNSLVDPDNRRKVDFEVRKRLLMEVKAMNVDEVCGRFDEGLPKLFLIQRALGFRGERPELFGAAADFHAVEASGEKAEHLIGFCRAGKVVALAPRLTLRLGGDWGATKVRFPDGRWRNILTDEGGYAGEVEAAELFRRFPVGLFAEEGGE